jgi:hypothetical protein
MKKLITICLLIATVFTVNAQQMNFDETVKYINEKLLLQYNVKNSIVADKSGNIYVEAYNKKFNFYDLDTNSIHYDDAEKRESGLELNSYGTGHNGEGRGYQITANIDKYNIALISHFDNQKDAERVFSALLHLKSLCTKTKDPFDK